MKFIERRTVTCENLDMSIISLAAASKSENLKLNLINMQ